MSLVLPIPPNTMNALKYFFEVVVVSYWTAQIVACLSRFHSRRTLNRKGHFPLHLTVQPDSFLLGAPVSILAVITVIVIHTIMIIFELNIDSVQVTTVQAAPVTYPLNQRISRFSKPSSWTQAAKFCCHEIDTPTTFGGYHTCDQRLCKSIRCTMPAKLHSPTARVVMMKVLKTRDGNFVCTGSSATTMEVGNMKQVEFAVSTNVAALQNHYGDTAHFCSSFHKNGNEVFLCSYSIPSSY